MWVSKLYYCIKPAVPRPAQISLRRCLANWKLQKCNNFWPIDQAASKSPEGWPGWPEEKKFALILTHDVETAVGQKNCISLKKHEEALGFRSCFNFVPERYPVSPDIRKDIHDSGFEIGVHGLKHDGKLYSSRRVFSERAARINKYLKEWNAVGFRSPSMHHNLEWIKELNVDYDSSTFDTDPFEPQADGVRTIFPFWLEYKNRKRILEIPYTLPQDFTLFVILKLKTIDIWKKKLDWIAKHGGMAVLNVHPDYLDFGTKEMNGQTYPLKHYLELLTYLKTNYSGQYWQALPKEVYQYCESEFPQRLNS